jgi:hypothetical protein
MTTFHVHLNNPTCFEQDIVINYANKSGQKKTRTLTLTITDERGTLVPLNNPRLKSVFEAAIRELSTEINKTNDFDNVDSLDLDFAEAQPDDGSGANANGASSFSLKGATCLAKDKSQVTLSLATVTGIFQRVCSVLAAVKTSASQNATRGQQSGNPGTFNNNTQPRNHFGNSGGQIPQSSIQRTNSNASDGAQKGNFSQQETSSLGGIDLNFNIDFDTVNDAGSAGLIRNSKAPQQSGVPQPQTAPQPGQGTSSTASATQPVVDDTTSPPDASSTPSRAVSLQRTDQRSSSRQLPAPNSRSIKNNAPYIINPVLAQPTSSNSNTSNRTTGYANPFMGQKTSSNASNRFKSEDEFLTATGSEDEYSTVTENRDEALDTGVGPFRSSDSFFEQEETVTPPVSLSGSRRAKTVNNSSRNNRSPATAPDRIFTRQPNSSGKLPVPHSQSIKNNTPFILNPTHVQTTSSNSNTSNRTTKYPNPLMDQKTPSNTSHRSQYMSDAEYEYSDEDFSTEDTDHDVDTGVDPFAEFMQSSNLLLEKNANNRSTVSVTAKQT